MILHAHSKVNLYLDVTKKRDDGFHDILTLFQTTPYYDEIDIEFNEYEIFSCNKKLNFSWKQNLIKKSIDLFKNETGYKFNLKIKLNKSLPMGGGIGGGSSDSAAILKFLGNEFNVSLNDLFIIGEKIGSDVPFLIKGGTAIAEGKGEKLTFLDELNLKIKIYPQNVSISTPEMYKEIDKSWNTLNRCGNPYKLYEALKQNNYYEIKNNMFNIFEQVVFKKYAKIKEKKSELIERNKNELIMMSGSGSTIFEIVR
ncbi:4-diphosphocytidyl-2-C-methyl-D-erythritol kinase [Tepiditoga spiralis]|uniref:4-diphosphocytidyl-2-C-methyl-D-erythritol kinase n=1 Tax=Tepiditoga spiralis TaxID=2108365 RepID=A0A7G1G775_9BACT|nr:4-(cytidine 5'-diphospho)-2-C-methyl-D-erythritol kinase [Tepiditoga spiralis]BBE31024.1 4-diphosphocytidyl-2-C-methyl-D-erythritol kinase [Tepiditoga spiralis]